MASTVYRNRLIQPVLRWIALIAYRCCGWKIEGSKPAHSRYVVIAAPHTSNWDFFYTVCLAFIYRLEPQMMMKADWFFWPLGPILKWLGAIPIDRRKSNSVVSQSISAFERCEQMVLVVPPSGTRQKVKYWKTGFYYIAHGANVPIVLGFLDYFRKVGGFGPWIMPSGDIERDMIAIRRFYADITGKFPLQESGATIAADIDGAK